jgi:hypothetical protein
LLRIPIIRDNGLSDRNTDFPFFCLPNWAIQSIDRNKQNSGSKTNYFRFSKAGLISNHLFIRFYSQNGVRPTARLHAVGDFPSTLSVPISNIQRRQQKDEIGEAWLFAVCADFLSTLFHF